MGVAPPNQLSSVLQKFSGKFCLSLQVARFGYTYIPVGMAMGVLSWTSEFGFACSYRLVGLR